MTKGEEPAVEQIFEEEEKERDKDMEERDQVAQRDDDVDDSSLDSVYSYSTYVNDAYAVLLGLNARHRVCTNRIFKVSFI